MKTEWDLILFVVGLFLIIGGVGIFAIHRSLEHEKIEDAARRHCIESNMSWIEGSCLRNQ